jgi:ribonucleotide reductase beta subunit family protein with ferritin-like domain
MPLLKERLAFKPFEYQWAYDAWFKQQNAHWLHTEINMQKDIKDWNEGLTPAEKNVIGNILKGFTQTETIVGEYWSSYVTKWFKIPEIKMMAITFGAFETIHSVSYSYLNDTLGLTDFEAFLEDEATMKKLNSLMEIDSNDTSLTNISRSLALFSACAEGIQLYSSFAVLLSFMKKNMMTGISKQMIFSVRDECHVEGTEILTNKGWVDFRNLNIETDLIGQYNNDKTIEFVKASKFIKNFIDEDIISVDHKRLSFKVTKNHNLLYSKDKATILKETADKILYNTAIFYPATAKIKNDNKNILTDFERFCILIQADGFKSKQKNGDVRGKKGGFNIQITVNKERKIQRIHEILNNLNYEYKTKIDKKARTVFDVKAPLFDYKNLNWVLDKTNLDLSWCEDFIQEIIKWDGHIRTDNNGEYDSFLYCSTEKSCIDIVSYIGTLCGYKTNIYKSIDNRKESYKDYYRLSLCNKDIEFITSGSLRKVKKTEHYKGNVYCVSVPSGMILTRYNNTVLIGGNCLHSESGCHLFRDLINENPNIWTPELQEVLYEGVDLALQNEFNYIDKIFEMGDLETITKEQLKNFMYDRANRKLKELMLKPKYEINDVLLREMDWFYITTSGEQQTDFFAGRESSYAKPNEDWNNTDDLF